MICDLFLETVVTNNLVIENNGDYCLTLKYNIGDQLLGTVVISD